MNVSDTLNYCSYFRGTAQQEYTTFYKNARANSTIDSFARISRIPMKIRHNGHRINECGNDHADQSR